jgi:hypothetical protein
MTTLPFETTFYDTLYLSISSVLREKFPQQPEEDLLTWHRRLLYEFVSYLQATYEPEVQVKIPAGAKNDNKKKKDPPPPPIENQTMFNSNIENALNIVTQDPDFAVYLFAWWFPIITAPSDTITISLNVDCTSTVAAACQLRKVQISLSWFEFRLVAVNDADTTHAVLADPFVTSVFRAIQQNRLSSEQILKDPGKTTMSVNDPNPYVNTTQIASVLWRLKNILQPLFISGISISGVDGADLTVTKDTTDKQDRKRFNAKKYIKDDTVTPEQMSGGILQTVVLSIFRCFYDYDAATIDPVLFDYLFLKQNNLTL